MEKLKQLWEWFNGKKSAIGGYVLLIALILPQINQQVLINIWHLETPVWFDPLIQTFDWVGGILTGAGLIHKGLKK